MPRTLSVEEYKELGKRYYGRKEYQKALDAFTDGINASGGRDIQLYDYRAATYDKMDDSKAALDSSRSMIRSFENDPRGYLRAGQLLQNMEKSQQALQIYIRGLKYVSATHPQINLLRGAHDKLNRELCPPKAIDPFTQLPMEVVEMIMVYLKFYELVSCLRVSKEWKLFLGSLPSLWIKMDLLRAGRKRTVKPSFVKTCIRMAQGKITYARIANFGNRGILQHLVTTCKALETLEFVLTPLGPDSILEAAIPARHLKSLTIHADIEMPVEKVRQILKHRPGLEELRVLHLSHSTDKEFTSDLPHLKVLDLRSIHIRFIVTEAFKTLLARAPNLRELVLEQETTGGTVPVSQTTTMLEALQQLETLRLKTGLFVGFPQLPKTLRTLDIECMAPYLRTDEPHDLPKLEKLSLRNVQCDPLLLLESADLNDEVSMLSSFTVSSTFPPYWRSIDQVLQHHRLQNIEELGLEGQSAYELHDEDVDLLVQLRNLKRLSVDSAGITGLGIKKLVNGLKGGLQDLTLTACEDVGRDAVDWAARQGVAVKVNETRLKNKFVIRRAV